MQEPISYLEDTRDADAEPCQHGHCPDECDACNADDDGDDVPEWCDVCGEPLVVAAEDYSGPGGYVHAACGAEVDAQIDDLRGAA